MPIYLILFKEGDFQFKKERPGPEFYQIGAKVFQVKGSTTIEEVMAWKNAGFTSIQYFKEV